MKKKDLLITNFHCDFSGGGHHIMQILFLLGDYFNIFTEDNIDFYTDPYWKSVGYDFKINQITQLEKPDVHLFSGYRNWIQPRGMFNLQLCYFPVEKSYLGWNNFIVCNDFIKMHLTKMLPNSNIYKIPIYFSPDKFNSSSSKDNSVICIGNYFQENDGHSKNQHLIIQWFQKFKDILKIEKLILHGFSNDLFYLNKLFRLINNDDKIEFNLGAPRDKIINDLSRSRYLVHANGYRRKIPEQSEHFGMIAVEALLSGVMPIVHNSGGCKDISGVKVYDELDEISEIILNHPFPDRKKLTQYGMEFSKQASIDAATSLIRSIYTN